MRTHSMTPRKHTEDDMAYFHRLSTKQKEERACAVALAKKEAEANGKEPFDWERFDALYEVSNDTEGYVPSKDVVAQYEEKYYCRHPEIMTIEAFVRFLEEMDVWKDWQPDDPAFR